MKALLLTILLLPLFSLAQTKDFTITGNVTGLPEGAEVKIISIPDNNKIISKSKAKGNAFILKGSVPEPGLYLIILGNEPPQQIFLENTAIKIKGSKKDIKHLQIAGTQSQKDVDDLGTVFNPLMGEISSVAAQINGIANDVDRRNSLMQRYDSLATVIQQEVTKFVTAKRSSYVSPYLLLFMFKFIDDPVYMEQRYNSLDGTIRNSMIGKSLSDMIAYNKVGAIGTDALDFSLPDVNGTQVSLASLKGKYVLLDFWASWCRPCREENPNVVKAYQKFKDKNFTILGVSLDQQKEPWLRAIDKDNIAWTQVSDLQFWNNAAAVLYHVQGIPQNFLIDPNGKIVAKNLRGDDLEAKLTELLGNK